MPSPNLVATLVTIVTVATAPTTPDTVAEPPSVAVEERRLVDEAGDPIQLRGVSRSGTEYACVQGFGPFDGPVDGRAIAAMAEWDINAVRIPLNEDCWLGAPEIPSELSGSAYRTAIVEYADRLAAAGMVVVLDLHWTGTSGDVARAQQPMARHDRSPRFWRSVAAEFGDRPWVIFDAFNEPHDISWECWREGCGEYAGMQDLVDAIRSVGATQPIMLSGLDWGGDLRGWLQYQPDDPADALIAGVHLYDFKRCVAEACWDSEIGDVAARVPVVISEFGDTDCDGNFSKDLMGWADLSGLSYLAWTWNSWDCGGGPALLISHDGGPTRYGETVRAHFQARMPPVDLPVLIPCGGIPV